MSDIELELKSNKRPFSGPNICVKCDRSFTEKKNLNKHCRKYHPQDEIDTTRKHQKCGICNATFFYSSELLEHYKNEHNVRLNFINETFYTESDFLEWKQKIENDGLSSFVLEKRYELVSGEKVTQYKCHRSGMKRVATKMKESTKSDCNYPGKNKERRKNVSVKLGCTCPAFIKVSTQTVDDISELKVVYQSVHVGHILEAKRSRLSKKKRKTLASSLNRDIPMAKPKYGYTYYVCQKLPPTAVVSEPEMQLMDSAILIIDTDESKEKQMFEKNTTVSTLKKQSAISSDLATAKETLINSIQQLQKQVLSVDEISDIKNVQHLINAANSYLVSANLSYT